MALTELESKITKAVEKLSDSVVTIRSTKANINPYSGQPIQGAGSGFIIDSIGNIVSNFHVVAGANKVEVVLKDGRTFTGTVVGGDKATDIVVIKIDGTNLTPVKLGDSEKLKVGQMALAIGNALDLPGAPTVSAGVISAIGRPLPWADFVFEGLLQTDTPINPGNSGGPLADLDGNVVGINTAIVPFAQGVGFAIPINTVKWVIEQVLEKGRVVRPMLGVSVININQVVARRFQLQTQTGVLVGSVAAKSPAAQARLREGDVILKVGEYEIKNVKDLLVALSKLSVKQSVNVTYMRGGQTEQVALRLSESTQ